jgi:hypothetical protein
MPAAQPHKELLCTTRQFAGNVVVSTGAGSVTTLFSSDELRRPAQVSRVDPDGWSTVQDTQVQLLGER